MTHGGGSEDSLRSGDGRPTSPLDTSWPVLADRYRAVLRVLDRDGATSIESVARDLTDRDFRGSGVTPTTADYERTRRALDAVHLPYLIDAGMVERTSGREGDDAADEQLRLTDRVGPLSASATTERE